MLDFLETKFGLASAPMTHISCRPSVGRTRAQTCRQDSIRATSPLRQSKKSAVPRQNAIIESNRTTS